MGQKNKNKMQNCECGKSTQLYLEPKIKNTFGSSDLMTKICGYFG